MTEAAQDSLDGIELMRSLSPEERRAVAQRCRWLRYGPDEQIIDRQSDARDVFFVVKGRVRVVIYAVSGREVTLDDIGANAYFGELAALDGRPRSASVMALEDTTVAILSPEAFVALVSQSPTVALQVMKRLANVVRTSTDRIMDLSTLAANNRVHAELLRLARMNLQEERRAVLKPPPVHSEIASRVSTTRETVARVFSELARQGIVERQGGFLVIADVERLVKLVEDVRGE